MTDLRVVPVGLAAPDIDIDAVGQLADLGQFPYVARRSGRDMLPDAPLSQRSRYSRAVPGTEFSAWGGVRPHWAVPGALTGITQETADIPAAPDGTGMRTPAVTDRRLVTRTVNHEVDGQWVAESHDLPKGQVTLVDCGSFDHEGEDDAAFPGRVKGLLQSTAVSHRRRTRCCPDQG
jgi:hypothetical protein